MERHPLEMLPQPSKLISFCVTNVEAQIWLPKLRNIEWEPQQMEFLMGNRGANKFKNKNVSWWWGDSVAKEGRGTVQESLISVCRI